MSLEIKKDTVKNGLEGIRNKNSNLKKSSRNLPIASAKSKLIEEISKNDTCIIVGETGSGKTTQLPQFLHVAGFSKRGMIGVTQPRRVAAISVSSRVAEERHVALGKEVGYSVRFEDVTSDLTKIKFVTDGMLLREALLDPLLTKYQVIVVDEAHERTLCTDILLALLKQVQKRRNSKEGIGAENDKKADVAPLKLVIMSATLDWKKFSSYFDNAKCVYIKGRNYNVDIFYTDSPEEDYMDAALITILQLHIEEEEGDILVFLTGQEEIESMEAMLAKKAFNLPKDSMKMAIIPIFSALPSDQQLKVFLPSPSFTRKVILATNIAETSLTIPGVRFVIDPGLVKIKTFNSKTGMESLIVCPISKAQARQRSGRAGREGEGKCYRLYTESSFEALSENTIPEIKRCNLSSVILQLVSFGIKHLTSFDFFEPPSKLSVMKSLEELLTLGALTQDCQLSDLGKKMSSLPLDPMYSKAVISSHAMGCSEEIVTVVAMLSTESVFFSPKEKMNEAKAAKSRFVNRLGDHLTLINVFKSFVNEVNQIESKDCLNDENDGLLGQSGEKMNEKGIQKGKKRKKMSFKNEKVLKNWCNSQFLSFRALKKAVEVYKQIKDYCKGMGIILTSCNDNFDQIRKCLTSSFFMNAASKNPDSTYRYLGTGQVVSIHPSSVLFGMKPDCVIFNSLILTNKTYIRDLTGIELSWLADFAPQYYHLKNKA